jgi:flagellar basal-body rod protein FlgB
MFESLQITKMARALAAHQGQRMALVAGNLANADTPGYRAQDLPPFDPAPFAGEGLRATRPGHLAAPGAPPPPRPFEVAAAAEPNGNTVAVEGEMLRAAEVRQTHEMALAVYRATADVLRASLGRR